MEEKTNSPASPAEYDAPVAKRGIGARFIDSFRRAEGATVTPPGAVGADGKVFDIEHAAQATAESPLSRKLKGRHLQMIAIGGSIGEYPNTNHCGPRWEAARLEGVVCWRYACLGAA